MTSPTKAFFDELPQRAHVPWLAQEQGRIRCEIVNGDCIQLWTVAFDDGEVQVDRDDSRADGALRADQALFDRIVTGQEKMLPAALRGEFSLTGSLDLIVLFSKLFDGPTEQHGPRFVDRQTAGGAR
jgi:hypothetical protein